MTRVGCALAIVLRRAGRFRSRRNASPSVRTKTCLRCITVGFGARSSVYGLECLAHGVNASVLAVGSPTHERDLSLGGVRTEIDLAHGVRGMQRPTRPGHHRYS